jgi:hypothetical protein
VKVIVLLLLTVSSSAIGADELVAPGEAQTPPRLSFIDGQTSFWRAGANDWVPARVNTPLAPGDSLYTRELSNVEIQVGARAFARMAEKIQLGLVNLEPDFLQFGEAKGVGSLFLKDNFALR